MNPILSQIETQDGDSFQLIKKIDEDNVWRLYVEGEINLKVAWLKQKHSELYKMAITMFPNDKLILSAHPIHDPYDKYGQGTILEKEEKDCISAFKDIYENLSESKKIDIIRKVLMLM